MMRVMLLLGGIGAATTLAFHLGARHVAPAPAAADTTRSLDSVLGDRLSVKDWGAICDGVVNDETPILLAKEWARETSRPLLGCDDEPVR